MNSAFVGMAVEAQKRVAELEAELARLNPIVEAAREIVHWWSGGDESPYPGLDRLEDAVHAADAEATEPAPLIDHVREVMG